MSFDYVTGSYFDVLLGGNPFGMSGQFSRVSGLGMQFEYETYTEGGSSYPRFFFKNAVTQTLVLEQGTVTTLDTFSTLVDLVNLGMSVPLAGIIILRDYTGAPKRSWIIAGAHITKYEGPALDGNQSEIAVTRIELTYNGCS